MTELEMKRHGTRVPGVFILAVDKNNRTAAEVLRAPGSKHWHQHHSRRKNDARLAVKNATWPLWPPSSVPAVAV